MDFHFYIDSYSYSIRFFSIYRLRIHYPYTNISELLALLLGKWIGRISIFIFILYFSFLMVFSLASLIDLVAIVFLPDTPVIAILTWFWIFFIYAATKGIKRIALTASVLAFITMFTGHTVTVLDSGQKKWNNLLPILEFGWSPVFWGTLILVSIWIELLLLLCIPIKHIEQKRFFLIWVIGILLNALMMFSTTTGVITIFGLGQAENFVYPAAEIVRIVSLGFIDRFDVYALILMTFGTYIRCSLYFRIAYEISVSKASSEWGKRAIFTFLAAAGFFGALYLSNDHIRIGRAIDIYTYMVFLFPLPLFLLWISQTKRRKNKGMIHQNEGQ
ncbi:endospore germination permease [Mesobacillus jeotgali]|uniref:endospore germination permease n=1 Tax=Mesobacillus jeotgali TaxID=129985 RepID=UPI0009A66492|nr:endospore germination permease [Mesobacillus jeotgali]